MYSVDSRTGVLACQPSWPCDAARSHGACVFSGSWYAGGQSPRTRRLASSWATIHLSPSDALLGGGVTGSFSRAQGAPRHHQTPGRATRTSMWWKSGSHHPSMRISMIGSFRELPPTVRGRGQPLSLSLIHISEPTRLLSISYAVFCLKKKKKQK